MPIYVVEREYLQPFYQRVVVDAKNRPQACRLAKELEDWDNPPGAPDLAGASENYIVAIAVGEDPAALSRREDREVGSPGVPEQHQGGMHLVLKVADELGDQIKVLVEAEADHEEIERLERWRNLLRQVT
jgi:hypothetical protein